MTLLNGGYAQRYGDRTGAEVDFRLGEGSRERRQFPRGRERNQRVRGGGGPIGSEAGLLALTARQSYLQLLVER